NSLCMIPTEDKVKFNTVCSTPVSQKVVDMVRFSNFSSPEYIMELSKMQTFVASNRYKPLTGGQRGSLPRCPGSHVGYQLSGTVQTCGWSLWSPYRGTFSAARRLRRSTLLEPRWLPLATSPS
uniref:Uncharacterized protein n=1 Tax=Scophthalmus maximus TaxID=52904 RepID=A0A8D3CRC8_SCOMX